MLKPTTADLADENESLRHRVEVLKSEVAALKRELAEANALIEKLESTDADN